MRSTASTLISGSTSSEDGSSNTDTSSSGRGPKYNLSRTKGPDGWINVGLSNEETKPKRPYESGKSKPPKPPPLNRIPSEKNQPKEEEGTGKKERKE